MSAISASATFNQIFRYIHLVQSSVPCIFPSVSLSLSLSSFACNPFCCPRRSSALFVSLSFVVFYSRRDFLPASKMLMKSRLSFRYLLRCRGAALVHTAKSSTCYRCNTFANESGELGSSSLCLRETVSYPDLVFFLRNTNAS